jgi:hypothetical protein
MYIHVYITNSCICIHSINTYVYLYVCISYEAQEPLVSGSILTGEAAVAKRDKKSSSNKVRSKTSEEVRMEEEADVAVEMALLRYTLL